MLGGLWELATLLPRALGGGLLAALRPQPSSNGAPPFAQNAPDRHSPLKAAIFASALPSPTAPDAPMNPILDERTDPLLPSDNGDSAHAEHAPEEAPDTVVFAGESFMPLTAALESLLFVADKPVEPAQLARALRLPPEAVAEGLRRFAELLVEQERGLRLQTTQAGKVRLVTRPDAAPAVEEFLNLDLVTRLSGPALETLAVIAYRQPVTRAQIEIVRGVDCGGVLRTLLQRGLIEEVGRLEGVGRPFLYGITEQFMHHFGLIHIGELPPLAAEESDLLAASVDQAPPPLSPQTDADPAEGLAQETQPD